MASLKTATTQPPDKHHHTNGTESPLSGTTFDDDDEGFDLLSPDSPQRNLSWLYDLANNDPWIKQVIMAEESGNPAFLAEALDAGLDPNYIIDPVTNDSLLNVFTIEVRQHHTNSLSGAITMAFSSHELPVIPSI